MEAAHTSPNQAPPLSGEGQAAPMLVSQDTHLRRCLVSGEMLPKTELLRFVVGPDHALYPDLAQNLPGRGLWVSATRDAVTTAAKKNLFAKAAKTSVKVAPDLADQVAQLLHKRCLDFIGLSKRSGTAVLGQTQVEAELKSGKLVLLLLADDASTDLRSYRATKNLKISTIFTRQELGAALGHEQLVYLGFKRHALTGKLEAELERLEKIAKPHHSDTTTGIAG
jgi:predicted RNA-binding protein YlxR (DUF448 family)